MYTFLCINWWGFFLSHFPNVLGVESEDWRGEVTCQRQVVPLVSSRARSRAQVPDTLSLNLVIFPPCHPAPILSGDLKTVLSCLLYSRLDESDVPLCPLTSLPPFHHPRGPSSSRYNWSSVPAVPLGSGSRRWLMLWRPGLLSRRLWISVGWCCAVRWRWGPCLTQMYTSLLPECSLSSSDPPPKNSGA